MNTLLVQGVGIPRAEMQCYDPDDDGDTTPVETVVPWDPDGGDDDRRRFEGEELLFLDGDGRRRRATDGVGSRCAWTPLTATDRLPKADGLPLHTLIRSRGIPCRPAPATGGTFIIFPGE